MIGAGASALVVELVGAGYRSIEVIDVSAAALDQLTALLGADATAVCSRRIDVLDVTFASPLDVWHDRATFHFFTEPVDQCAYVARAAAAVRPDGHVVLATFSTSGPSRCSGLPVARHDVASIAHTFAPHFEVLESFERAHVTPWGAPQTFLHALLQRNGD